MSPTLKTKHNPNDYRCKFCNELMDSSELKKDTFQSTLECNNHPELQSELNANYGLHYPAIHYTFKFFTRFEPTLISITIYINPRLKIMYFPKNEHPEINLYLHMPDSPASMKLLEARATPSNYFAWKEITNLPPSLIDKPLKDIINKINSLKAFF